MNWISRVRNEWNALVETMELPSVFLTWEWITAWLDQFGERYELFVLMGYEQDELVCILPLAKRKMRLEDGFIKQRVMTFCGAHELYPDHLDIICSKNSGSDKIGKYIDELMGYIFMGNTAFDILMLPYLAEEGHLTRWLQSNAIDGKISRVREDVAPYMLIDGNVDKILQSMGKKKRYNIKREVRILLDQNNVHLALLTDSQEIAGSLTDLIRLHAARSNQKGIDSTFMPVDVLDFHRKFMNRASEISWVRMYQLVHNSNVIACAYGFLFRDRFYYYQTGFDPAWSSFSPGNVIIYLMLEQLAQSGAKVFDFLGGSDSYKYFWTKKQHLMPTYLMFNKGVIPAVEYYAMWARGVMKKIMRWTLFQWNVRWKSIGLKRETVPERHAEDDG